MVSRQVRRRGLHSERCWGKYDNVVKEKTMLSGNHIYC
jgi:hypothetical protein